MKEPNYFEVQNVPFPEYQIYSPPPSYPQQTVPQQPVKQEESESPYWRGIITGISVFSLLEITRVLIFGI